MSTNLDLNELLYRRNRTGRRGRPTNSGRRDFDALYSICQLLAANPSLSRAAAIRQTVDVERDYNAIDRLTRKLGRYPHMLERARDYRTRQIDRFVSSTRRATLEIEMIGFDSRKAVEAYLLMKAMASPDILNDKEVQKAVDRAWAAARRSPLAEMRKVQAMLNRFSVYDEIERRVAEVNRINQIFNPLQSW